MLKKLFHSALCAALLTMTLCIPSFAAEENDLLISPAPQVQGDFLVKVNGEYVTFTDAVPQIKNDRSCLPFVAVFEQLGFAEENMTWDGATKTVTATKPGVTYTPFNGGEERQGDVTVTLTIGSNTFTVQYEGDTTADSHGKTVPVFRGFESEAAPYIDPATSRTYIPFGLVADALNYNVGWDAQDRVVIIDDVDAILAENDATYQLMDKYLDYSKTYAEKNYNVTGGYTLYMNLTDPTLAMEFLCNGEYDMLTSGSTAMQFETDMVLDAAMVSEGVDLMTGEMAEMFPLTVDMELRADMNDGMFYLQSAALAELMGQPDAANIWYKLDLSELFDSLSSVTGMNYATLIDLNGDMLNMSFEEYLAIMLKSMPLTDADLTTSSYLDMLNLFLADDNFKKSGSTYVNTMDLEGLGEMNFTLYTSGSKVNGYSITVSMDDAAGALMEMEVSMRSNQMEAFFGIGVEDAGTSIALTMSMGGQYKATQKIPATQPPADAAVLDLMGLLGTSEEFIPLPETAP